jgi:hypothetical protein
MVIINKYILFSSFCIKHLFINTIYYHNYIYKIKIQFIKILEKEKNKVKDKPEFQDFNILTNILSYDTDCKY